MWARVSAVDSLFKTRASESCGAGLAAVAVAVAMARGSDLIVRVWKRVCMLQSDDCCIPEVCDGGKLRQGCAGFDVTDVPPEAARRLSIVNHAICTGRKQSAWTAG